MVALTQAGGEECGAPGDYVSWEDEDWKLTSQARMEMVEELEGPCRRESEVTVYTADFQYHSAATNPGKHSGCTLTTPLANGFVRSGGGIYNTCVPALEWSCGVRVVSTQRRKGTHG